MDRWISAVCQNLIKKARDEMQQYKLYKVVPKLLSFLEELTKWYVRLNRQRLKGDQGEKEMTIALNVLFNVVLKSTILMSPFVPFLTEMIYENLKRVLDPKSKYLD